VRVRLRLFQAKLLVKLVNTSTGVDQFLFARIKRVTLGADFNLYILLCTPCFNNLTASASDRCLLVVGMNPYLHYVHLFLFRNIAKDILAQVS
jgi:hypothetical protein